MSVRLEREGRAVELIRDADLCASCAIARVEKAEEEARVWVRAAEEHSADVDRWGAAVLDAIDALPDE